VCAVDRGDECVWSICVYLCAGVYARVNVCTYIFMEVCMYVCNFAGLCVYMCVHDTC